MTTEVYPPIPPDELLVEEDASAARELTWLLSSLNDTLITLRTGLTECLSLIHPSDTNSSTLVLSSPRSESLKGYVTRVGDRIIKADMQIKMYGLPFTRGTNAYRLTLAAPKGTGIGQGEGSGKEGDERKGGREEFDSRKDGKSGKDGKDGGVESGPPPPQKPQPPPTAHVNTMLTSHNPHPHAHHNSHHSSHYHQSNNNSPKNNHSHYSFPPPSEDRLVLRQLTDLRHHLSHSIHLINTFSLPTLATPSSLQPTPIPDSTTVLHHSTNTLASLTHLLQTIRLAKSTLTHPPPHSTFPHTRSIPAHIFDPPLPSQLALDLYIRDAAIVAEIRSVETVPPPGSADTEASVGGKLAGMLTSGASSLWHNLASGIGGNTSSGKGGSGKAGFYEEIGKVVFWRDREGSVGVGEGLGESAGRWVRVRDKVKVDSQDPRLMAVMVKVGGLEHAIGVAMEAVETVKGVMLARGQVGVDVGGGGEQEGEGVGHTSTGAAPVGSIAGTLKAQVIMEQMKGTEVIV